MPGSLRTWGGKLLVVGGKLATSANCCCDGAAGCDEGNCICTQVTLVETNCDPYTPATIHFAIDEVSCTPVGVPPATNNCTVAGEAAGVIVPGCAAPACSYEITRTPLGSNDRCCNYQTTFDPADMICCDCLQNLGSTAVALFSFTCVQDQSGDCVIKGTLSLCGTIYSITGWDLTADANTPNTLTKQSEDPGTCCTWPATIEAWGETP